MNTKKIRELLHKIQKGDWHISRSGLHNYLFNYVFFDEKREGSDTKFPYPQEIDINQGIYKILINKAAEFAEIPESFDATTKEFNNSSYQSALCLLLAAIICDDFSKTILSLNQVLKLSFSIKGVDKHHHVIKLQGFCTDHYSHLVDLYETEIISNFCYKNNLNAMIKVFQIKPSEGVLKLQEGERLAETEAETNLESHHLESPQAISQDAEEQWWDIDINFNDQWSVQCVNMKKAGTNLPQSKFDQIAEKLNAHYNVLADEVVTLTKNNRVHRLTSVKCAALFTLAAKLMDKSSVEDKMRAIESAKDNNDLTSQRYTRGFLLSKLSCGWFKSTTENLIDESIVLCNSGGMIR